MHIVKHNRNAGTATTVQNSSYSEKVISKSVVLLGITNKPSDRATALTEAKPLVHLHLSLTATVQVVSEVAQSWGLWKQWTVGDTRPNLHVLTPQTHNK